MSRPPLELPIRLLLVCWLSVGHSHKPSRSALLGRFKRDRSRNRGVTGRSRPWVRSRLESHILVVFAVVQERVGIFGNGWSCCSVGEHLLEIGKANAFAWGECLVQA